MLRRVLIIVMLLLLPAFASLAIAEESAKSSKKSAVKKSSAKKKKPKKSDLPGAKTAIPPAALLTGKSSQAPVSVTEMKHWTTPDYTRIAVTLDREATFERHEIATAPGSKQLSRIFFDINGAKLTAGARDLNIGDGFLKTVRAAQYRPDTVRIVLDVDNIREYKIFTFSDPFRIIVDVKGERQTEISSLTPTISALQKPFDPPKTVLENVVKRETPVTAPVVKPLLKPGKIRRIVVDPGHGGKDPGAVGPGGLQEKDVVLAIGTLVAKRIRDLGIDAVMTRSTDVFIELQERTAIANQVGADLFVSVHANAAVNRKASGVETYYLNLAKTEKAAQLAARENGTSLEKVSVLQAVLFDLMANYKLKDSAHLAEEVQRALVRRMKGDDPATKDLGVKQGPFYVLVGATMPSILVESAFISNPQDEEKLANPRFLEMTADGIVDGITAYIAALK